MSFWTANAAEAGFKEPKRKFRFKVEFTSWKDDNGSPVLWYAKTATKPSFTIAAGEHKYLNYTFYYPGTLSWNEVEITLVDPTTPDVAGKLWEFLGSSGWVVPGTPSAQTADEAFSTISKDRAVSGLGLVNITQLDSKGTEIEKWTMHNAFVIDVKFGDLAYGDDELTELSLTIKYDWALLDDSVPLPATTPATTTA